jgi:hypothetical protein
MGCYLSLIFHTLYDIDVSQLVLYYNEQNVINLQTHLEIRIQRNAGRWATKGPAGYSRHVYETFIRFVLRYVLRNDLREKLVTPKYRRRSCFMMSPDDIFRISK